MERSQPPLELWAGIECTRNRVGDQRHDQLELTGHARRPSDMDLIVELGVPAIRYPVLWEQVHATVDAEPDWSWPDERLAVLREAGVRPVAGLLHHSGGPPGTDFDDPAFPELFAAYARSFAERYPWVNEFVPINEPLTTARFCGLYGFWHPHARDDRKFAQIFLAQMRATVLAVRAIKQVIPDAVFVQNEDIGTIRAVAPLQYEADFQNIRRWSTFDVLCGRWTPDHPMVAFMLRAGIAERELRWFEENPCPPDIVAVDNYITSDRLLDPAMHRYPESFHGGNHHDRYVDIEAVRATAEEAPGVLAGLREAWDRYGLPLAIGEAHMGCTREEQMRWLGESWASARQARDEGADVRAVCVWATFGGYDWNTLVTERNDYYEPGAFDVRTGPARATGLAKMMQGLACDGTYDHPVLDVRGWWRRSDRLTFSPVDDLAPLPFANPPVALPEPQRARHIAVIGASEPVLDALRRICDVRGLAVDGSSADAWASVIVLGCARRDRRIPSPAGRMGREPVLLLSCHHAARHDNPCRDRERQVVAPGMLVARMGDRLDPWDERDPVVDALIRGRAVTKTAVMNTVVKPAYLPDALNAALDLLVDGETGVVQLDHGTDVRLRDLIEQIRAAASGTAIASAGPRGALLPSLADAVARFAVESAPLWSERTPEVVEVDEGSGPAFDLPADEPTTTTSAPRESRAGTG